MAALCLAVIGKNNQPLYLRDFADRTAENVMLSEEEFFGIPTKDYSSESTRSSQCSTRHQFMLHSALDRVEQLSGPPPGVGWRKPDAVGSDGMFMGLLCPSEEMRVYGYMTTTNIVFMLIVEDDTTSDTKESIDSEIKTLLTNIHQLYIADTLNPFKDIGSPIISKRFDAGVQGYISEFNQTGGMI